MNGISNRNSTKESVPPEGPMRATEQLPVWESFAIDEHNSPVNRTLLGARIGSSQRGGAGPLFGLSVRVINSQRMGSRLSQQADGSPLHPLSLSKGGGQGHVGNGLSRHLDWLLSGSRHEDSDSLDWTGLDGTGHIDISSCCKYTYGPAVAARYSGPTFHSCSILSITASSFSSARSALRACSTCAIEAIFFLFALFSITADFSRAVSMTCSGRFANLATFKP